MVPCTVHCTSCTVLVFVCLRPLVTDKFPPLSLTGLVDDADTVNVFGLADVVCTVDVITTVGVVDVSRYVCLSVTICNYL